MNLLAAIDTEELQQIGETIAEGVRTGLGTTAEQAPTNWILMFASVAAMLIIAGVAVMFLRDMRTGRGEIASLFARFTEASERASVGCHANSQALAAKSDQHVAALTDAVHDLKGCTSDLKETQRDTRRVVEAAMDRLVLEK